MPLQVYRICQGMRSGMGRIAALIFPVLLLAGCRHSPLSGKWYMGPEHQIEFGPNGNFRTKYLTEADSLVQHKGVFSIKNDTLLVVQYTDISGDFTLHYRIRDSILYMFTEPTTMLGVEFPADAYYFHRNPDHPPYHTEQLYRYGGIRDTSREPPVFEFEF